MQTKNYQVFLAWLIDFASNDPMGFDAKFGQVVRQDILAKNVDIADVLGCALHVAAELVRGDLVLPFEEAPNLLHPAVT